MIPTENDFEVSFEREATPIPDDLPFNILFLGDYSGHEQSSDSRNDELISIEIDRDNFDDVLNSLNVSLCLDLHGNGKDLLNLNFYELEDFHPDRLFEKIPFFNNLRTIRKELLDPNTFQIAAINIRKWLNLEDLQNENTESNAAIDSQASGSLLDDILDDKKAASESYNSSTTSLSDLDSFIKEIMRHHIVPTDETEQANLLAIVDRVISELMRKILHHKDFKALESSWRGLYFVVKRIETRRSLKLFLMDLDKDALVGKLKNSKELGDSVLFKHIVQSNNVEDFNNDAWALICGNYEFEIDTEDTAALIRIAKICDAISAPFISYLKTDFLRFHSSSELANSSEFDFSDDSKQSKLLNILRTIPEADNLAFSLPKFLTRLPYGEKTEPTELFSFEEFTEEFDDNDYLWSNAAYICTLLLAQNFTANAWIFSNRFNIGLSGLPTPIYYSDGEAKAKSCLEVDLSQDTCEFLVGLGFSPLVSFQNSDAIKLVNLQSISLSNGRLKGKWN